MRFLNWIFAKAHQIDDTLPPIDLTVIQDRRPVDPLPAEDSPEVIEVERRSHIISDAPAYRIPQPEIVTAAKSSPLAAPVTDPAEGDIFHLDYATADGPVKRRRVEFLFASPGSLVTGVDLDQRRLRTYRIDRMRRIIRPADSLEFEPMAFFSRFPVIATTGFHPAGDPHATALEMRKAMFCQLSLLLLMSTADGPLKGNHLDLIMKYAQRENRFATREGWVQTGDKRAVWPLLRGMVNQLRPRPDLVDVFVGTLQENWENPRRFTALNDALTDLAHMGGGPSAARTALAAAINR